MTSGSSLSPTASSIAVGTAGLNKYIRGCWTQSSHHSSPISEQNQEPGPAWAGIGVAWDRCGLLAPCYLVLDPWQALLINHCTFFPLSQGGSSWPDR